MEDFASEELPHVDPKLVEALEKLFPNISPNLLDTEREVWYKAGASSVVTFLTEVLRRQSESILN
tara:strand:+ start:3426 stop:3620 length:195 start_codon:yes stop_codon:yes gene_type:complete